MQIVCNAPVLRLCLFCVRILCCACVRILCLFCVCANCVHVVCCACVLFCVVPGVEVYVLHISLFFLCVCVCAFCVQIVCCILFCCCLCIYMFAGVWLIMCVSCYLCSVCVCVCGVRLRLFATQSDTPHVGCLCGYMVRIIKAKKTQPLIKLKSIWFSTFLLCFKIMLIFSEKVSIK